MYVYVSLYTPFQKSALNVANYGLVQFTKKQKNFSIFLVTSNLVAHAWSIKYR